MRTTEPKDRIAASVECGDVDFESSIQVTPSALAASSAIVPSTFALGEGATIEVSLANPGAQPSVDGRPLGITDATGHLALDAIAAGNAVLIEATGYERGTITPFGMTTAWPVIADTRLRGREISLGAGGHGVAAIVDADQALAVLGALVSDVTDPEA